MLSLFQRAAQHVGDNFHVAVTVGAEALAAHDLVFIDHQQRAEADVLGIVVVAEREAVFGIEPAVVGFAAGIGMTYLQHGELL
jgi:hypothetical protein